MHFILLQSHPPLSSLPFEVDDEQKEIIIQQKSKKWCTFCPERSQNFTRLTMVVQRFREGVIQMLLRTYKLYQPSVKDTQARIVCVFPCVINPLSSSFALLQS